MVRKLTIIILQVVLTMLFLSAWRVQAQSGRNVEVRFPVATRVGGDTLEPGSYQMEIIQKAEEPIIVRIRKTGRTEVVASIQAVAVQGQQRAERNAVKVLFREGVYYLDKLLLSGEDNLYQFKP